jgi:hypothetical protein
LALRLVSRVSHRMPHSKGNQAQEAGPQFQEDRDSRIIHTLRRRGDDSTLLARCSRTILTQFHLQFLATGTSSAVSTIFMPHWSEKAKRWRKLALTLITSTTERGDWQHCK